MYRYISVVLVFLSFGIAWRTCYDVGWAFIFLCVVLTSFLFLIVGTTRSWRGVFLLIAISAFTVGLIRMETAIPTFAPLPKNAEEQIVVGTVIREPDARESFTNVIVESDAFEYRVLVRAPVFTDVWYGDVVRVVGIFELPENFEGDSGRIFNYKGYLAKDGVQFIIANPQISVLEHNASLTRILLTAKTRYLEALKKVLGEPYAALAGGITVGENKSLGEKLSQDFRDVGLVHIVVLSGYNIAVVVVFIVALLSFLPQRIRYSIAIVCIILFTLLVGASATVVRAAIMGCIGAIGTMMGRTYDALYTLMLAGVGMLLWNPYVLVYDPSFQLSFIATFGLIVGSPLLMSKLSYVPEVFGFREIIAATISTQIAVVPLLLYMMGAISVSAFIVNLLVLPVIPVAMLLVFVTGLIAVISVTAALLPAFLTQVLLSYVVSVVTFFAKIPFSVLHIVVFPLTFAVMAYILLFIAVWYIKRKGDSEQK